MLDITACRATFDMYTVFHHRVNFFANNEKNGERADAAAPATFLG